MKITLLSLPFILSGALLSRAEALLPAADQVVQKVIERAQQSQPLDQHKSYTYSKRVVSEDLDPDGNPIRRKEEVREVTPSQDSANQKRKYQFELNEELLGRFQFEVLGRETLQGRPALVLAFEPRSDRLPVRQMQDRFLNRAAGKVWIDEREYELVKADIHLLEPVKFIGGVVGAVHRFNYILERIRLDEGVWITERTRFYLKARQFLKPVHLRKEEVWSNFMRMARTD
jgi:hypothetical protein